MLHTLWKGFTNIYADVNKIRLTYSHCFCWIYFAPVFGFYVLLNPCLFFFSFLYLDLCVFGYDALIIGVFHANQISMCLDPHLN